MSKLRYNASLDIFLEVYYAIFFSHLTYGCNLWGLTSEENISKIEVLQRKCIRIMTFAPYNSHSNDLFMELSLMKVRDLISLSQLKIVFDFKNSSLPSDLMSLFQLSSNVHTTHRELNSTVNNLLYIPKAKTSTYGLQSIRYQCPKLWNEIFKKGFTQVDNDVKNNIKLSDIKTKKGFKNILKKYFLHSYTIEPEVIFY